MLSHTGVVKGWNTEVIRATIPILSDNLNNDDVITKV